MSTNTPKKISVIGLGYIGLPTAAMFASNGINVIGVDVDKEIINTINKGNIHIVEPNLDILVKESVNKGFLSATDEPQPADVFIIAVPTPFKSDINEGSIPQPELKYIESASRQLAKVLKKGDIVILESTSPVGTTKKMSMWMEQERSDITFPHSHGESSDIRVAHCPERVLPGKVIEELIHNERIIGGITKNCSLAAKEIYELFVKGECIITNAQTAEMAKLTENASRDVSIAFANELSMICDSIDIDVWELINLANRHPRVNILNPGPGVGGHCIAVDPWFIVNKSPEDSLLIKTSRNINDSKPVWVTKKIKEYAAEFFTNKLKENSDDFVIAFYGIAFKPNIDDLRGSPAISIVEKILEDNIGTILVIEPNINFLPNSLKGAKLSTIDNALKTADLHVMLVKHDQFLDININSNHVIDFVGINK